MKKVKLLFVITFLLLFITNAYNSVYATENNTDEFVYGNNSDGTLSIIGYTGTDETITIPSEKDGKKVISIRKLNNYNVKHIIVSDGITTIEGSSLWDSINLVSITLPNSVSSINYTAFHDPLFLTIIADPNSYAKEFADTYEMPFCCIKHPNVVYTEAIEPTYYKEGRTEGYICSICGTPISGCKDIPKLTLSPLIPTPKTNNTVTVSSSTYKVTNTKASNSTVEYSGTKKAKKSIIIPATIKVDGKKYKVTSVAKNAFKNNKKLKKITIGNNIKKINANAFKGCKKLKTITIKSKKLKSIGKNAFKGINPKAKIKVPESKLKKYKKLFKNKGLKSTVKIIKI